MKKIFGTPFGENFAGDAPNLKREVDARTEASAGLATAVSDILKGGEVPDAALIF